LGRQEGEAAQQLELRAQRDLTILEVTRTARHLAEIDLQLEEANRFAHSCFLFSDFFFWQLSQCTGTFLTPGFRIRDVKNTDPRSAINFRVRENITKSLLTIIWVKNA
jgi:hypothetical protein